jgi:hypothetical protein
MITTYITLKNNSLHQMETANTVEDKAYWKMMAESYDKKINSELKKMWL